MGKLHTLRRAIERDPEMWVRRTYHNATRVNGAYFNRRLGRWEAVYSGPYYPFIKHVLKQIGFI